MVDRNNPHELITREESLGKPRPNFSKKVYSPPKLRVYGHLRDITLGSTGGINESGGNGDGYHWDF